MDAARELNRDLAMLERVAAGDRSEFRTWLCRSPTVVLGRSADHESEVNEVFCRDNGIEIVRRASGGGTVLIGPGTLQWAFALPHALSTELATIPGAKRFCNRILLAALDESRADDKDGPSSDPIAIHESGDLLIGDRKIGGIALKRKRSAGLIHGTLLIDTDLAMIDGALRHPPREPDYRRGRVHSAFLSNLGADSIQRDRMEKAILSQLRTA